ncbi:peptidoglycan DD-metalloendopeptidase family protein [Microvirga pakistanensis]|uniref:peptidoglycan DD-metalloendopeptidase family protein n=1 Tax=Microvirga pakistanensis TaxID=1682650 RepID=UPI00141A9971|nr:peptidoglycan DD-metalloendopeptidase family protein [Microvirga pakistanensis]
MHTQFHSIVEGRMRSRGRDAFGSGQPGASRGSRDHLGIDVIANPMQRILAPIDGNVIREAFPYKNDPSMRGILIRGAGDYIEWEVKLFYVEGLFSGQVKAGSLIGHAQSLGNKYPGITNHIHMEVFRRGTQVDPREPFAMCF